MVLAALAIKFLELMFFVGPSGLSAAPCQAVPVKAPGGCVHVTVPVAAQSAAVRQSARAQAIVGSCDESAGPIVPSAEGKANPIKCLSTGQARVGKVRGEAVRIN